MNIRISLSDSDVRRALRQLRDAADDMSPAMQEVAGLLATSTENRFNTKRAPDGSAWAALSKATQARRLKRSKPANNPLVLSGRLKRSITTAYDRRSVVVGTDVPYASTHQEGARRGEFGSFSVVARTARGRSGQRSKRDRRHYPTAPATGD